MGQNECARLGVSLNPMGLKSHIFANVYVLLVKSECTAGSNSQNECTAGSNSQNECATGGFFLSQGAKINIFDIVYMF